MRIPRRLLSVLRGEGPFLIAAHIDPDGDAIGSSLALSAALEAAGKKTFLYSRDPLPKYFAFLPGRKKFTARLREIVEEDPVLVLLDCNSPERAGIEGRRFRKAVVIDHHETAKEFGDVRWVDHTAAATGILVYRLVKALGGRITPEIATNLYTAISVDTGTFRYSNTSADVLRVSAELVDAGAEPNRIADHLYETWEYKRFRLLVAALNTIEVRDGVAVIHITKKMFRDTGTSAEDTEYFSNYPRMIGSIRIAVLLRELEQRGWKASLRSKGAVNVARIAERFGGGGHRNAAGFKTTSDLKTIKDTLFQAGRRSRR
ncbi:MAG: bifunctional oligoribonuclease/PAP phosphatase NrnA [Nitrospiraceae bacterium]|nr:bifunctional oligoribonuclease/PAP phosphatase NrnA [Nitrospiraceae bacterium]